MRTKKKIEREKTFNSYDRICEDIFIIHNPIFVCDGTIIACEVYLRKRFPKSSQNCKSFPSR